MFSINLSPAVSFSTCGIYLCYRPCVHLLSQFILQIMTLRSYSISSASNNSRPSNLDNISVMFLSINHINSAITYALINIMCLSNTILVVPYVLVCQFPSRSSSYDKINPSTNIMYLLAALRLINCRALCRYWYFRKLDWNRV